MIGCVDVYYRMTQAVAAGIAFRDWPDDTVAAERVISLPVVQPYKPGRFFVRELPCLLAVLPLLPAVQVVVIDGYVWLEDDRPGLGAHLYHSLDGRIPVIGVAKSDYLGAENVQQIIRGKSKQPLYISAVGLDLAEAAEHVQSMHGPYRIPTLLKKVDLLSKCPRRLEKRPSKFLP